MSEPSEPSDIFERLYRAAVDWRAALMTVFAILGCVVVVALIATVGAANRQRDAALERQSRSYEVMIRTRTVAASIAEAEATLGRFVISGDKALGRLYYDKWLYAGQHIKRLETDTRSNPGQAQLVAALQRAYQKRGEELAEVASYSNYKRNMSALGRYYDMRDTPALNAVKQRLDAILEHERRRLLLRSQDAQTSLEHSNAVARILMAFGILLVCFAALLGWMMVRAETRRAAADAATEIERNRAHELEAAVASATAELQEQARVREATEARLRQSQKMEAVGQLTGGIAHDFNNMLAVVLGGLELAKRHLRSRSEDAERHIESAMEGANRAAVLTRRLLTFSRSDALLPDAVLPVELIAGMSDLLDRVLGDGITVSTSSTPPEWAVFADRHQLENALLNLAVNARDAMDGRGRLTIATGAATLQAREVGENEPGDYVTIAVSDTGSGMEPEVLERVFEPFFTTKPVGKGTGLGLSQIFGFVRQSDGEIGIVSVPGQGTTVTLYLPRHLADAVAERAQAEAPAPVGLSDLPLHILVVEDDPRVLSASCAALAELGHRPVACGDPREAAATFDGMERCDLILSDVLMPEMTGPEMIASLGTRVDTVPIVYVTGYTGDASEALETQGATVLRKPFTLAGLEDAVTVAVSQARTHTDRHRRAGARG